MVALITTAGYSQHFDAVADQSWLSYDPSGTGTKNEADDRFISYDDPTSISHKGADLSPAQAGVGGTLGGAFVFELSGDFMSTAPAGQQHPLLTAAHGMKYLLPGLVTNLTATSPTDTSAKLTWTAASGASSYNVYFENGPGTGPASLAATVSASPATISGLTSGKQYYFLVEGVNAFGSGVTTQVSVTVMLPPPPTAPQDLRAYPGNNSVLLIWEASAGATSYSVYTGSGTLLASNLKTTSYERTSLTNGVSYSFYVVAVNIGGSTKSTTVSATPASVPAAPVLSSSGGNAQVKLTWTAVAGASSYTLSDGTVSHGETTLVKGLTVTSYTVTGLKNGTTYYFFVQAVNAKGASWPSNESSATPLLPPSVPTGVKATPGNEIITLSWNASTSTTSYNVYKGTAKGAETLAVSTTGTAYTFNDLTNGQTYWFYVVAVNADGTSAHSAEVSATPTSPIKPPTNLTATPVSISGSVTLNWTASAGATASYDYNVYQGSASGGEGATAVKTVTSNATTATISGLASNKSYYFEVKAVSGGQTSTASNEAVANPRVVWVPDFWGELVQVRIGGGTTTTAITFSLPQCNPNSLAVNGTKLYVACSAYTTNPDKILVYNATTIKAAPSGTLVISPLQTISSAQFSSLIGITFDAHNNLWIASNGNNEVLSISAATLNTTTPVVTVGLVDSPSAPVALAFDTDGSLWVTGLYGDGILLNFVSSQLFQGEAAEPRYCISSDNLGAGCVYNNGLFEEPEGVALFNGGIWVANNSTGTDGTTPGRELVNLKVAAGALSVNTIFGNTSTPADSPFVCPGGLFATSSHLWVNDESYGESPPECGAAGDVASKTGGIFSFTSAQLVAKTTTISQVLSYADITGRPGFGGIFVENDQ